MNRIAWVILGVSLFKNTHTHTRPGSPGSLERSIIPVLSDRFRVTGGDLSREILPVLPNKARLPVWHASTSEGPSDVRLGSSLV